MTSTAERPIESVRVQRARPVVLGALALNVAGVIALPLSLVDLTSWVGWLVMGTLIAAHAVVYVITLRMAVTPWSEPRTRHRVMALLIGITMIIWPVTYGWAEVGQEPWAWLAAFTMGLAPVAVPRLWAVIIAIGLTTATIIGAVVWGGSWQQNMMFALGCGSAVALMNMFTVWMLRLLEAAEDGTEAVARLAVSEERLRFARDLHDLLGHRLGVIALKAELVGRLAGGDPPRASAEAEEIRELATSTLREVRQAVHGYGTVDLAEQLRSADLVLGSAGITVEATVAPVTAGPAVSQFVGAVVREGVANILQHSDADHVRIDLHEEADRLTLVIENDHPHPAGSGSGLGLMGLAERGALVGGTVATEGDDDRYTLRVEVVSR